MHGGGRVMFSRAQASIQKTFGMMKMIIKAWVNGTLVLLILLAIHAAGGSQAMQARLDHPACHPNLKP